MADGLWGMRSGERWYKVQNRVVFFEHSEVALAQADALGDEWGVDEIEPEKGIPVSMDLGEHLARLVFGLWCDGHGLVSFGRGPLDFHSELARRCSLPRNMGTAKRQSDDYAVWRGR